MRTLTLMAATLLLAACNTTPREPLVGADRDEHGCIGSAGYQWSALAGKCVRLFEQGIRLNPTDAGQTVSAFVLFNADQSQAELTLPEGEPIRLRATGPGRAAAISSSPGRAMCSNPVTMCSITVI